MTQTIKIECARPNHLEAIVTIINAGAASVRKNREFTDWQDYRPAFDALRSAQEADIYVAVTGDNEVVGTFQIHFLKGMAFKGRPRVTVESVHVRADLRGKGIGRQMMARAEELALDMDACMIQLTSNKEREGSHLFYMSLGYDQSHLGYKKMLAQRHESNTGC